MQNYLTLVDYCVVAGTLFFSLGIGVYYAILGNNKGNNEELLSGGRSMGAIPVAASILVSYLSAITILGLPAEVYAHGTQILFPSLWSIVTTPIGVLMFVRTMYDLKLTSAFKYLELRYNSTIVRCGSSLIFIFQLLFLSGIVLYAPAIAMETMMGIPKTYSVIAIGFCGTIYTSIGGIKAVVWADMFQFIMIFMGMSAIVARGIVTAGGVVEMFQIANDRGRLQLFDWTIDPFMRHNTLNFILGSVMSTAYCHQPIVQRYCGLSSYQEALKSIMWCWIFEAGTISLVVITGIAIFSHYADCDPLTASLIETDDQIVPYFVVRELGFIPGMMGLFVAVVFSAVLSTISSTLNSLAAVTWEDFLSKIGFFHGMGDFAQATTYKILTVVYGTICVLLSFVAESFGGIFQSCITVIGTAAGVQGSLYLMGVFFPFVNKHGAMWGMLVGATVMSYVAMTAMEVGEKFNINPKLPISTSTCSNLDISRSSDFFSNKPSKQNIDELEFPQKMFGISYQLYSLIGGVLTLSVAMVVSVLTGGCKEAQYVRPEYLHPILRGSRKVVTVKPKPSRVQNSEAFAENLKDEKV